jgi:hypothetical protein
MQTFNQHLHHLIKEALAGGSLPYVAYFHGSILCLTKGTKAAW